MELQTYFRPDGMMIGEDDEVIHDAKVGHAWNEAWDKMGAEYASRGIHGMVAVAVLAELERRAATVLERITALPTPPTEAV